MNVVVLLMIYAAKYVFQINKKDRNLNVFNMITGINKSKTLIKHISCNCRCKFNGRKCSSKQK